MSPGNQQVLRRMGVKAVLWTAGTGLCIASSVLHAAPVQLETQGLLGSNSHVAADVYASGSGAHIYHDERVCSDLNCNKAIPPGPMRSDAPMNRYIGTASLNMSPMQITTSGNMKTAAGEPNYSSGSFESGAAQYIYVRLPPGTQVKVTISGTASASYDSPSSNAVAYAGSGYGGAFSSDFNVTYLMLVSNSPYVFGGQTYYLVDTIFASGHAGAGLSDGLTHNSSYSSSVSVQVRLVGKVIQMGTPSGNGQTGVVGHISKEPVRVLVVDGETGAPVRDVLVNFSMPTRPVGETRGDVLSSIGTTDPAGETGTLFVYGNAPGNYGIQAFCESCVAFQTANFSETAVTTQTATELKLIHCPENGTIRQPSRNAFRVQAFDKYSGVGVKDFPTTFSVISPVGGGGASVQPSSTQTDRFGIAQSVIALGNTAGEYVFRARCTQCLANPEVICRASTRPPPAFNASPDPGPPAANPDTPDPDTNRPATPLLRIVSVQYPNAGGSFTTRDGENTVHLVADLKPTDYSSQYASNITWTATDAPDDFMDSGDPADPIMGPATDLMLPIPPVPSKSMEGRPAPLRYVIQARVDTANGPLTSAPIMVKQDEVDKCRQEYIDFDTAPPVLPRDNFTLGVDGEFVHYRDCYAHVYPTARAQEIRSLRQTIGFGITVSNGYRSPRKNKQVGSQKLSTSKHMFGEAVDVVPSPSSAANFQTLWNSTACPKILERPGRRGQINVIKCYTNGETQALEPNALDDLNGNGILDGFELANVIHLGD